MLAKSAKLFIDDGGESETPIVFLHSLAGNTTQWSAQLSHVRQTNRAIAIDMRGHGQSITHENELFTIDAMVQDIQKIVDDLNIQQFILVGHSMGGGVAVAYAGRHPERVVGLLLVDPSGDSTQMPEGQVQQFIGAMESNGYTDFIEGYWQHILTGATEVTRTGVMQDLRNTPQETVVGIFKALFRFNPVYDLNQYTGPKLAVVIPATETPLSLHKIQPNFPTKMVTGTGHWLHMDKPQLFNKILDEFVTSIED